MARPGSPHTVKLPCQFCSVDLAVKKVKHHGWCPVINPVDEGPMHDWQKILLDDNAAISRQCIARVELEHLHKGAPGWLSQIKKS